MSIIVSTVSYRIALPTFLLVSVFVATCVHKCSILRANRVSSGVRPIDSSLSLTCARMSFIASLESSSLLPKIRSSLNIRTWEKQQSHWFYSDTQTGYMVISLEEAPEGINKVVRLSGLANFVQVLFQCRKKPDQRQQNDENTLNTQVLSASWKRGESPAEKDHLCQTHHAPESTQTWWGSSGFSPTAEQARERQHKRKDRHQNSLSSFGKYLSSYSLNYLEIK